MTTTLLAVDDSKTMRRVLEITFAGEDFKTLLCESADEALAKLAENPHIALVDAGLDNAGGYELCQRIKAASPNVAVVMLSSKQQPYDRARGTAVGADDFVDKPFDTQQLLEKVTTIVRRAASAPAMAQVAPSPVVMPSASGGRGSEPVRARVQTLAYGLPSNPMIPESKASPAAVQPVAPARPTLASTPPVELGSASGWGPPAAPAAAPIVPLPAALPADFARKLGGLGLNQAQLEAVLALSREVVEQVVWEVVPPLAETIIKEELKRLLQA